jgi:hypothetical protein
MVIDGHFHFHYPTKTQDSEILSQLPRIEKIRKKNSLDKILSVIPLENSGILNYLKNYSYFYPGVYIFIEDYKKELIEEIKKFNFVKIQHWLSMPYLLPENLENLFLDSISIGKKKFQIHTESINENNLGLIERFIKDYDVKIYLVHGVYALYSYSSKITPNELRKLEGNLFLGVSPFWSMVEIPNCSLIKAVGDGLENMIVFESDFILDYKDSFYDSTLESVRNSVGENVKILNENIQRFLE